MTISRSHRKSWNCTAQRDSDTDSRVEVSDSSESGEQWERNSNSSAIAPRLRSRDHLLSELPLDLRRHFLSTHIICANATIPQAARRVREYSRISWAHHSEVVSWLNEPENTSVSLSATRWALPKLACFPSGTKKRKVKFAKLVTNLVQTYQSFHGDLARSEHFLALSKGMRTSGMGSIFDNPKTQCLSIDISNSKPYTGVEEYVALDPWTGAHNKTHHNDHGVVMDDEAMVKALNVGLKKITKEQRAGRVEIICQQQPFLTVRLPLVTNLAEHCISIQCLHSLDLGSRLFLAYWLIEDEEGSTKRADLQTLYVAKLAQFIAGNKSLRILHLEGNSVDARSLVTLAQSFKLNTSISKLELSGNPLGTTTGRSFDDRGVKALAEALKANTSIRYLGLRRCAIDDQAANHLLEMLRQNKTIEMIDLREDNAVPADHPLRADRRVRFEYGDNDESLTSRSLFDSES